MADKISPMMEQFINIKEKYPDHILFYRVGDFYEMFNEDAIVASKELDLVLTGKDCGQKERAPMCGVPYHSCDSYISRLVNKGYKVAICEQVEDPKATKKLVKRDVIKVITPGTVSDGSMLNEKQNNYLCSLIICNNNASLTFSDVSTGEIFYTYIDSQIIPRIITELAKFTPKEILINDEALAIDEILSFINEKLYAVVTKVEPFSKDDALQPILKHFNVISTQKLGINDTQSSILSIFYTLMYIEQTQKCDISFMNKLNVYSDNQFMGIDISTKRNLEIVENLSGKKKNATLLNVIDKTMSALGARKLKNFIERPIIDVVEINKRQDAVEELLNNPIELDNLRELLNGVYDLERIMTRVMFNNCNAKDMLSLKNTFEKLPAIKQALKSFKSVKLVGVDSGIDALPEIYDLLDKAIEPKAPNTIKEGKIIKRGYNAEIDELAKLTEDTAEVIKETESLEKEKTGIKTLKIGYNRVFGYYIEVSKLFSDKVPEEYIRKQTLTNGERYITPYLKELELKILNAKEKLFSLEYEEFCKIRQIVANNLAKIQKTADSIALLDVFCSLAYVASENNYVRPLVDNSDTIEIIEGRHPVVEKVLKKTLFVPNDTLLNSKDQRIIILTGPNMGGKSTYMRQIALIVILAQIGSFVPAQSAKIGIVDKVFTRVGASDDLSAGQSTFMVEMSEVANILKNATSKSLLIFDEIGRGTSTYDGMSIAKAVVEYTANVKKIGAKSLFATHYHELCELENEIEGIKNFNVIVKKRGDDIIFLRRIVEGGADDSYGIEVASLAGVPKEVVKRAKEILAEIDQGTSFIKTAKPSISSDQLTLSNNDTNEIIDSLKKIDIQSLTPIEALNLLNEYSNKAKKIF